MAYVVYDSGALIAAERSSFLFRQRHRLILDRRHEVLVPVPVFTQVFRDDPRQHGLHVLMSTCTMHRAGEEIAKAAGRALRLTETSDAVDALVAATAASLRAPVVTSDPDDISALLCALGADKLPVLLA
jgi:hypothetical protein